MRKSWSEEEDNILKQRYPLKSCSEVAKLLGRSEQSVYSRAEKVLRVRKPPRWTANEDAFLRNLYGKFRNREIAKKLGKTKSAVEQRARVLGVHSSFFHTEKELETVRNLYPTTNLKEIARKLGKSEATIRYVAHKVGAHKAFVIPQLHLTEAEKGYIAGILDGEGTIAVHVRSGEGRKYKFGFGVQPYIGVANTKPELIHWLHYKLGGRHYSRSNNLVKRAYLWQISDIARIYAILKQVMPYLILKRENAVLVLELVERRLSRLKSAKYEERDIQIYHLVKKLNVKGPKRVG